MTRDAMNHRNFLTALGTMYSTALEPILSAAITDADGDSYYCSGPEA